MREDGASRRQFFELYEKLIQKNHSNGGAQGAIKGYLYQVDLCIKKILESDNDSEVIHETISDFSTREESGRIEIYQAKYTLKSGEAAKALNELFGIFKFISNEQPRLLENLWFYIACKDNHIGNFETRKKSWVANLPSIERTAAGKFLDRVRVKIENSPIEDCIHSLMVKYGDKNPFDTLKNLQLKLIASIQNGSGDTVAREFKNELDGKRIKNRKDAIYISRRLWNLKADSLPSQLHQPIQRADFKLGTANPAKEMIEGRYYYRPFYNSLLQHFRQAIPDGNLFNSKLPLYWISGGAGSGKSVCLNYLLTLLNSEIEESVIFKLDRDSGGLSRILEYLDSHFIYGNQLIIAIDDPYLHGKHDELREFVGNLIDSLIYQSTESAVREPIIICTGSILEYERCKDELFSQLYFRSEVEPLKEELLFDINNQKSDIPDIKKWLSAEGGGTLSSDENDIEKTLMQVVFQYTTESTVEEFSRSLKNRLKACRHEILAEFSQILASNRFGASYNRMFVSAWYETDPELKDNLDMFLSEFCEPDAPAYSLMHQVLANEVYDRLFPISTHLQQRKSHITQWVRRSVEVCENPTDQYAPLWFLSNKALSSPDSPDFSKLFKGVDEALSDIYNEAIKTPRTISFWPVWVYLNENLNLNLKIQPLDKISCELKSSDPDAQGVRLCCHLLISNNAKLGEQQRLVLRRTIQSITKDHERFALIGDLVLIEEHGGFESEIEKKIACEPQSEITRRVVRHLFNVNGAESERLIGRWLEASDINEAAWAATFTDYAKTYKISKTIKDRAVKYLLDGPKNRSWSYVWQSLYSQFPETKISDIGLQYLQQSNLDEGWAFVWEDLFDSGFKENKTLIDLGLKFLAASGHHIKSQRYVLEKVVRSSFCPPSFHIDWLSTTEIENYDWIYIWCIYAFDQGSDKHTVKVGIDDRIVEKATQWLSYEGVFHRSWVPVFTSIKGHHTFDITRYKEKLREWLEVTDFTHDSWQYLWEDYWGIHKSQQMTSWGLEWLQSFDPSHNGWIHVWSKLLAKESTLELEEFGFELLANYPMHQRWGTCFEKLAQTVKERPRLIRIAEDWLNHPIYKQHKFASEVAKNVKKLKRELKKTSGKPKPAKNVKIDLNRSGIAPNGMKIKPRKK